MTYTTKTQQALASMIKALEHSTRAYAAYVGIKDGRAVITNGFALLSFTSEDFGAEDKVINEYYQDVSYRFPSVAGVISQKAGEKISDEAAEQLEFLVKGWKKPGKAKAGKEGYLRFANGEFSLVQEARGAGRFFNPTLIGNYMKAVLKGGNITDVYIREEQLQITFDNGFMILVCEVVIAK